MILNWIKQVWWSTRSAWERLSVRIRGGLATGRASWGRICWLARARQFWWEQESCRNLEESKGIQSNLVEIQEFCPAGIPSKKSCKSGWKQEFSRPLQNHIPVNKFLRKKTKKNLRNPVFFCFSVQKINSCQTRITNLGLNSLTPKAPPIGNFWRPQIHRKHRKHTSKKYMSVCLTYESCQQKKTLARFQKHKNINITFLVPLQEKN